MQNWHTFIQECGDLLQQERTESNGLVSGGREASNPVLSVYLGAQAQAQAQVVMGVYRKYWHNAYALTQLAGDEYSVQTATEKIFSMLNTNAPFRNKHQVMIAYYWDLADDGFDALLEKMQPELKFAALLECSRIIFADCRKIRFPDKIPQRMNRLFDWAEQAGVSVVVFGDYSDAGILGDEDLWENYQIAAEITLLANSLWENNDQMMQADPAAQLYFQLKQGGLYSVAYNRVGRDTFGIAAVTLSTILQEYRRMLLKQDDAKLSVSLEEKIGDKSYRTLFHHFFGQQIAAVLPSADEIGFLDYLPEGPDEAAGSVKSEPRGLFSLFGKKKSVSAARKTSLEDLQDRVENSSIHHLTRKIYYEQPVQAWMDSDAGQELIRSWAGQRIMTQLNYDEIKSRLGEESKKLQELVQDQAYWRMDPLPDGLEGGKAMDCYFRETCFQKVAGELAQQLAEQMKSIANGVSGFERVLDDSIAFLQSAKVDESILHPYQNLTIEAVRENKEALLSGIRPGDTESLQMQLYKIYRWLIRTRPQYCYSLKQDLEFCRTANGTLGKGSVIDDCLDRDIEECLRLQIDQFPSNGMKFCIVNANAGFGEAIKKEIHGEIFNVGQNNCIERLMIYPIQRNSIL